MKLITQRDRILKYILDFGSITTKDAVIDLGILRLASRIFEMRQDMRIEDKMETGVNRYGEPVSYKRYFIIDRGEEFKFSKWDKVICTCVGLESAITNGKDYTVMNTLMYNGMPCVDIQDDDRKRLIVTEDYFRRK